LILNPTNEEKVFLYKHARALVHPSLSEGFGLTLLEAAHFNCPILASNIAVFQEIFGRYYAAFDPRDPEDIAQKLREVLKQKPSPNYSTLLKKYSFKKMAKETLDLYHRSLGE
jgi:alpha-1,2-rhamnosyltransferase